MAKRGPKTKSGQAAASPDNGESMSAYFRRVFAEQPALLEAGSNAATLERWLKDHPGVKKVPSNVEVNLANIQSLLRKEGRSRTQVEQAAEPDEAPLRRAGLVLEALEEQIDDALSLA